MKTFPYLFVITSLIQLSSCPNNKQSENSSDTTQIIAEIFKPNSALMIDFELNSADTLFILKSKTFYNQSWPDSLNKLAFIYIDDVATSRYFNKPGSGKIDARKRFGFGAFAIKNDSSFVGLTYFNSPTDYDCELVKEQDSWLLTDVNSVLFNPKADYGKSK